MSREIDLDFDRGDDSRTDHGEKEQHEKDYEQLNDKLNAIDDRVTELENQDSEEDLLQGKFRHFTGDIEVDDNKKENKRVIPNTVSNVYQSPTAKTIEKPFSNKNINHKW